VSVVGAYRRLRDWVQGRDTLDRTRELLGALLARQVRAQGAIASLHEVEFRVHSQFGDDGIIQWLVARLPSLPRRFIEFGVEDYTEANTRFLLVNDHWRGLVLDGSEENIARLRGRPWFWREALTARAAFVTRENVNDLLAEWAGDDGVGLLHIDVDGNDYWLWEALALRPGLVIMEYNALFGPERAITIPYDAGFRRFAAHRSGLYFGASIAALEHLGRKKGYALVGGNSAGNNAYFVREDLLGGHLRRVAAADAYAVPHFRDGRDDAGRLDFHDFGARQARLRGLPVVDVASGQAGTF
jgi:hypothetical protein